MEKPTKIMMGFSWQESFAGTLSCTQFLRDLAQRLQILSLAGVFPFLLPNLNVGLKI